MASVILSGDTSGTVTLSAPAVAGSTTQTLVNVTGTLAPIVSGTAVASTSGTSIDFIGIPSWVKRITVMYNGVSTSGASNVQIQLGSGSIQNTGYSSQCFSYNTNLTIISTTGAVVCQGTTAAAVRNGITTICNQSGNTWVFSGVIQHPNVDPSAGIVTLTGVLDRLRVTTMNGTDTFDAGSINIMYE